LDNLWGDRFRLSINEILAPFIGKQTVKHSLPHHENERQWSVNDSWSRILDNLGADKFHIVIHVVWLPP
jgi:hypothetical protein